MLSKRKIIERAKKKEKPELKELLLFLRKKGGIALKIASYLARPRRKAIAVNLEKLNKVTGENDAIVVPGKVLSQGELEHKIKIAAFSFSSKAEQKLKKAGCEIYGIKELIDKEKEKIKIVV